MTPQANTSCMNSLVSSEKLYLIKGLLAFLVAFAAAPATAADAMKTFKKWSVFVEVTPKPKTCWAATRILRDPETGQNYFLAVTRFRGIRDPQVSIYSDKRMRKSSAIYLEIAGRNYRMRSDGMSAWPTQNADKRIISELLKVSQAKQPSERIVFVGQKGVIRVQVRIDGFAQAMSIVTNKCARP
ncbi:hypothetical protein [uncultured Aliiroseovarius sp.]|uniref:hypothetical protein n=1 Tax=uncultured Aliiroseovarius sp. TaxID=1658783 RepID=UPI00262F2305|nr:hypothetical protein [uncultured Aliiroseovarius sp.]